MYIPASAAVEEHARLTALDRLNLVAAPPEAAFAKITRLTAMLLGVESCAVTLVGRDRVWLTGRHQVEFSECAREDAFCSHTIFSSEPLVVLDLKADARFAGNPMVQAPDGVRFYAGAPLTTAEGHRIGALCVLDGAPREAFGAAERRTLADMAALAMDLVEVRRLRNVGDIATQVVDASPDAILCTDEAGTIVFWNGAAERMFGHDADHAIGRSVDLIIPDRMRGGHDRSFARAAAGGETTLIGSTVELPAVRADGSEFPAELSLARWGADDANRGFAAIVRDVSSRQDLQRSQRRAEMFLDTVVEHLPAMLFVKDTRSREYLLINRAGEDLIGRPRSEIIGRTDADLFAQGKAYEQRDADALRAAGRGHLHESEFVRTDGRMVNLRTQRIVIDGPDARHQYILGMSEDVTEVREAEAEILRLALFDSLTGLVNRHTYVDRLHELATSGTPFALLAIDLDRFKAVNDQLGHLAGDAVLAKVGERLQSLIDANDVVARVGGDEFVILVVDLEPAVRARRLAEAALELVSRPYATARGNAHLGASIGIVLAPTDATTAQELRQCADLALYRAKETGRGTICSYHVGMDRAARDRQALEKDLRAAIDNGAITVAYQPVLATATGRISSVEALARWTHPTRGPIPPDLFISIAEECGLIGRLGDLMLVQACRDAMTWPREISVAVNLSPIQVQSGLLFDAVGQALAATGLPARRLQLEVTENLVIRDVERTFVELERLRELGVKILMDDFGKGYSSLSYFERFPFDKIKIDQSFTRGLGSARAAEAIVQAIVGLSKALGMGVVAEGVESAKQMDSLIALGCTHLQGYLFSRPVSAATIAAMVAPAGPVENPLLSAVRAAARR